MKKFILPFFLFFTFPAFLLSANDITFEKVYSDKDGEEFHKIKHESFPSRIFMLSSLHVVEGVNRLFVVLKVRATEKLILSVLRDWTFGNI